MGYFESLAEQGFQNNLPSREPNMVGVNKSGFLSVRFSPTRSKIFPSKELSRLSNQGIGIDAHGFQLFNQRGGREHPGKVG